LTDIVEIGERHRAVAADHPFATPIPAQFTNTRAGPWALDAVDDGGFPPKPRRRHRRPQRTPPISAATLSASLALSRTRGNPGALGGERRAVAAPNPDAPPVTDGGLILQLHGFLPGEIVVG